MLHMESDMEPSQCSDTGDKVGETAASQSHYLADVHARVTGQGSG